MSRESIRGLANAATPGPWHLWHGDDTYAMNCYGVTTDLCDHDMVDEAYHDEHTVALTLLQEPRYASLGDHITHGSGFGDWEDNARFIAASRTAVPLLLAVADAAGLTRNVMVRRGREFEGEWVAIPKEDFDALRAALAALEGQP